LEDRSRPRSPTEARLPRADARLLEPVRPGDPAFGRQFVRDHYEAIYRYLLYLARQPDLAEDLTQETFLQAWRRRETFQGRGSLRGWLLRIAHREFLHLLERHPAPSGPEELAEMPAPNGTAWLDTLALRQVIDGLPLEQREAVLLHYLEGYSSAEIARIVDAPAATVRYRLARARERLRQALGEGDLLYLNEPAAPMRQWAWLPLDQIHALEARLTRGTEVKEVTMERREFLRQAVMGTAGLALTETEKEVVDGRLTQKVTLAIKATAFTDLCTHLATETGIRIAAGASVADEKVTIFCEKLPLREVMRQLSRPFGYTWLRSGQVGEYKYELVQDLRSQLLEEELRNRDRNAALLAFEREIERYRPFLSLSPDEALARARSAPPEEKALLERFAGRGWGAIQMYFRLTPQSSRWTNWPGRHCGWSILSRAGSSGCPERREARDTPSWCRCSRNRRSNERSCRPHGAGPGPRRWRRPAGSTPGCARASRGSTRPTWTIRVCPWSLWSPRRRRSSPHGGTSGSSISWAHRARGPA
jgi:RNA polymerase sigma-70 factor, ECF subfamily